MLHCLTEASREGPLTNPVFLLPAPRPLDPRPAQELCMPEPHGPRPAIEQLFGGRSDLQSDPLSTVAVSGNPGSGKASVSGGRKAVAELFMRGLCRDLSHAARAEARNDFVGAEFCCGLKFQGFHVPRKPRLASAIVRKRAVSIPHGPDGILADERVRGCEDRAVLNGLRDLNTVERVVVETGQFRHLKRGRFVDGQGFHQ
jgi:hypothetical protein